MPSIVSQIEAVEGVILECEKRLDNIERSLRLAELSEKERDDLETEIGEVKERLDSNRKTLSSLRKENLKSMFVSVTVLALSGGVFYALWSSS